MIAANIRQTSIFCFNYNTNICIIVSTNIVFFYFGDTIVNTISTMRYNFMELPYDFEKRMKTMLGSEFDEFEKSYENEDFMRSG